MGMDYLYSIPVPRGEIRDRIDQELTNAMVDVVGSALIGNTYYGAVRNSKGTVFGVVVLVRNSQRDGFGIKIVDESMGPVDTKCPLKILNLLTEPQNEWASRWRDRCRAFHATKRGKPTLKNGDVIQFDSPVSFGVYGTYQTFKVQKIGRKVRFFTVGGTGYMECRISNYMGRSWQKVG
jgi:hypothetical protein